MNNSSRGEKAEACFKEGFACSQAVLSGFAEEFGLDRKPWKYVLIPHDGIAENVTLEWLAK